MRNKNNWSSIIFLFLRSTLAYFLAGLLVPYFWPIVATPFGSFAGFVAGLCIIGPLWYLIHFKKLILAVDAKTIVVDMGLGIGTAVFVRDAIANGILENMSSFLTLLAGFVFSVLLFSIWVPLVEKLGAKGGFISAFLIIGVCWYLNHGSQFPLIHQTSAIFVDMGFAAGFGSLFYGLAKGGSFRASIYILASALLGGLLAGVIL